MKKLLLFLAITALFACDKSNDISPGFIVSIEFDFSVFNSQDEDLLDPATPNHIEEDDIRLFYEIDGKILGVYNPYMANPRNFMIYEHENEYRIKVVLNDSDATEETITHIQWNDDDTDIIKARFTRTENIVRVNRIWLNDTLIWDSDTDGGIKYYKLTK